MKLTEAEVIEAIRSASLPADADGFTSLDLADVLAIDQKQAQYLLRKLSRAGKLFFAGTRTSQTIDGRSCRSPVYQLQSAA